MALFGVLIIQLWAKALRVVPVVVTSSVQKHQKEEILALTSVTFLIKSICCQTSQMMY